MLTRKDINEFKMIGYYATASIMFNRPDPSEIVIIGAIIFGLLGASCFSVRTKNDSDLLL